MSNIETNTAMPHVTALITVYNEQTWIAHAVGSLLAQSFADIEVLVIDDGSDDETPNILAAIRDPRLRIIRKERMGRATALAFGVEQARGVFIAILDADDEAYPKRIETQVNFMKDHPDIAWLGCGEERQDEQRTEQAIRLYPQDDAAIRRMATRCIPYSHSGVMFRTALREQSLNYDPKIPYLIDFDLFLRVAEKHKVANIGEALVMRRLRDVSFFQSRFKRRTQNRALARMSAGAVWRFRLPPWYFAYPLARLAYDWVPNRIKRVLRRSAGLSENFSEAP